MRYPTVWMGFRSLYVWKRLHLIPGCGASSDVWYYWFCFSNCELLPVVVPLYCVLKWWDVYWNLLLEGEWEKESFWGIVFTLLDQNEYVFNCSMSPTLLGHQNFEFVHWPQCFMVLSIWPNFSASCWRIQVRINLCALLFPITHSW